MFFFVASVGLKRFIAIQARCTFYFFIRCLYIRDMMTIDDHVCTLIPCQLSNARDQWYSSRSRKFTWHAKSIRRPNAIETHIWQMNRKRIRLSLAPTRPDSTFLDGSQNFDLRPTLLESPGIFHRCRIPELNIGQFIKLSPMSHRRLKRKTPHKSSTV